MDSLSVHFFCGLLEKPFWFWCSFVLSTPWSPDWRCLMSLSASYRVDRDGVSICHIRGNWTLFDVGVLKCGHGLTWSTVWGDEVQADVLMNPAGFPPQNVGTRRTRRGLHTDVVRRLIAYWSAIRWGSPDDRHWIDSLMASLPIIISILSATCSRTHSMPMVVSVTTVRSPHWSCILRFP